jgi:hypothetical protein
MTLRAWQLALFAVVVALAACALTRAMQPTPDPNPCVVLDASLTSAHAA